MLPTDLDELIGGALGRSLYELLRQRIEKTIVVPNPGAGAEWSASPPAGCTWDVLHIKYVFTTSAVVANRQETITVSDGATTFTRIGYGIAHAASLGINYYWGRLLGAISAALGGAATSYALPELIVPVGGSISSSTNNLDAGDAYTGISLRVREWSIAGVQQNLDTLGRYLR